MKSYALVLFGLLGVLMAGGCARSATKTDQAAAKSYPLRGEVVSVDATRKVLVVQHGAIEGLMPAMTMEFSVSAGDAASAKPGQRIRAQLIPEEKGDWRLEQIWPDDQTSVSEVANEALALRQDTLSRGGTAYRDIGEKIPEFALYDQDGRVVQSARFAGKQIMLNFIYSRCPVASMCPLSTAKMMKTQQLARAAGVKNLELISITLDPTYDTPGVLKQYALDRGIDTSNFSFLTGPENAINDLLAQFGVIAQFEGGLLKHTLSTLLINEKGQIIHRADGSVWEPKEFVEKMRKGMNPPLRIMDAGRWRQVAGITAGAIAVYVAVRLMPTGTNIPHVDYVPAGESTLQFCDPSNPQFLPAVTVQSPVAMTLGLAETPIAGREVAGVLTLRTYGRTPIGAKQILDSHGKKIHLLIVDPTLTDYQHVHPEPGEAPGSWTFHFKPRAGGQYRFFADFVPAATRVELYAWADLAVNGAPAAAEPATVHNWVSESDGIRFSLTPATEPIRARQIADLTLRMERIGGGTVPLEVIMQAFAHLVAFDEQRTGYAHMHPLEVDITKHPDPVHPVLTFKLQLPKAGRYVIWSEVQIAGRQVFAPFWFNVEP